MEGQHSSVSHSVALVTDSPPLGWRFKRFFSARQHAASNGTQGELPDTRGEQNMSAITSQIPGRRLAHAVASFAIGLLLTAGGLTGTSASAEIFADPCDDPAMIEMPCTTH